MTKLISYSKLVLLVAIAAFGLTSCGSDGDNPGGGSGAIGPSINLDYGPGLVSTDETINAGSMFKVQANTIAGDNNINALSITVNGTNVEPSKLIFAHLGGGSSLSNNPQAAFGDDQSGFVWEIDIESPADDGVYTYDFIVTDVANNTDTYSIDITIGNGGTGGGDMPTVGYNGGSDVDITNGWQSFALSAQPAGGLLSTIGVWRDGALISDLTSIRFGTTTADWVDFSANPMDLTGGDENGFDKNVYINTASFSQSSVITIRVSDADGDMTDVNINLNVAQTALSNTFTTVIFNNADGTGAGALDLDTGNAVSSSSLDSEVQDLGIDPAAPIATNWIQRIQAENGADMRLVGDDVVETFNFDSATSKEQIQDAYNASDIFTESINGVPVSPVIQADQLYTISKNGTYYLLKIDVVNATNVAYDNNDFYQVSIKY